MDLKNISFGEYLALDNQEEYSFFMRYSNVLNRAQDTFMIGDMTEKSFGIVKDLQFDMSQGMTWNQIIEYIMKFTGKDYGQIVALPLTKFCPGWKYIQGEIERITDIEMAALSYTPTNEEKEAGIDNLDILGVYLQIRKIALTLRYSIEQVKAMRYDEAFLELVTQKKLSEYESELSKVYKNKHAR